MSSYQEHVQAVAVDISRGLRGEQVGVAICALLVCAGTALEREVDRRNGEAPENIHLLIALIKHTLADFGEHNKSLPES